MRQEHRSRRLLQLAAAWPPHGTSTKRLMRRKRRRAELPRPEVVPRLLHRHHHLQHRLVYRGTMSCSKPTRVPLSRRWEYKLPPAPVLGRDPAAPSAGRDACPRALWKLIVSHGGYIEEGRNGVSRSRIITSSGSGGKTRSAAAWAVCTLPLRSMGLAWRQCSSNLCPTWACSWLRPLTCAPSFPR